MVPSSAEERKLQIFVGRRVLTEPLHSEQLDAQAGRDQEQCKWVNTDRQRKPERGQRNHHSKMIESQEKGREKKKTFYSKNMTNFYFKKPVSKRFNTCLICVSEKTKRETICRNYEGSWLNFPWTESLHVEKVKRVSRTIIEKDCLMNKAWNFRTFKINFRSYKLAKGGRVGSTCTRMEAEWHQNSHQHNQILESGGAKIQIPREMSF